ncbi:hypothetical protein [Streptomyces boluensis]|uniref:Uncharacterized protein n=1 Tax=Streptomyces boluensis TaxID=1775135 RepID=A0A964XNG9_9ACTN|nr:hypothetical protein [Streptomyces boluensis]NBE54186.1 hypothetical protein [Streptomyces boluensis]
MVNHQRRAAALAAVASALFVPISVAAALSGDRLGRRAANCRTAASPVLAARTSPDVRAALSFPLAVPPVAGHEEGSGLWCAPDSACRSAEGNPGAGRVRGVGRVLRRAQELGRRLARIEGRTYAP